MQRLVVLQRARPCSGAGGRKPPGLRTAAAPLHPLASFLQSMFDSREGAAAGILVCALRFLPVRCGGTRAPLSMAYATPQFWPTPVVMVLLATAHVIALQCEEL
jgi:hypothetical protein